MTSTITPPEADILARQNHADLVAGCDAYLRRYCVDSVPRDASRILTHGQRKYLDWLGRRASDKAEALRCCLAQVAEIESELDSLAGNDFGAAERRATLGRRHAYQLGQLRYAVGDLCMLQQEITRMEQEICLRPARG